MAISAAAAYAGQTTKTWNVTATADADSGAFNIAHGFGSAPQVVNITPLLAAGNTSAWFVSAIDATNITLTKGSTGAGSGNASPQLRVSAILPHSLIG